ncbi:hypothetical protein HYU16_00515 [Candidatus Woesearchaeota archaeon]|nr:hypothetical protein [Candidatus Woesearchaeota archaeon]
MKKIWEMAENTVRQLLGLKVLLIIAVMTLSLLLLQAGSVSSAELQIGGTKSGTSIWHEVGGVGRLNITPEIAKVGETVLYQYANYTAFDQGLNITLRFKNDQGYINAVEVLRAVQKTVTIYNISVEQLFNPENSSFYNQTTVNTSTTAITVREWVNVPAAKSVNGSDYYYTAQFFVGEQVRFKPKAKTYGGMIKYDTILHPSTLSPTQTTRIEIDPIIDATTAVDDFNNANDINQSRTTGGVVNGVFVPLNASIWDTWDDQEYATNPQWVNTTTSGTTGVTIKFAPAGDKGYAFSYSATCDGTNTFSCSTFRADNISVQQNEVGTMISTHMMQLEGAVTMGVGIRINWDAIGATDNNPYSSSSGDSLLCLGAAGDGVLYFLQYDNGAGTAKANPTWSGSTGTWYNLTFTFNKTHAKCTMGDGTAAGNEDTGWVAHDLSNLDSGKPIFMFQRGGAATRWNVTNFSVSNTTSPMKYNNVTLESKVLNSTASVGFVNLSLDFHQRYSSVSVPTCQVFDANHQNTQNVTIGNRTNPVKNTLATSITGIGYNCSFTGVNRPDTYFVLNSTTLSWTLAAGGGGNANEAEGDTAIELGINSSIPTATKYKEQQVYVRNLSNNQTTGRFDWVASLGSQRWLLNYVTAGENYVNAPNLTTAVYVLEITNKTFAQITDEVSRHINATKS